VFLATAGWATPSAAFDRPAISRLRLNADKLDQQLRPEYGDIEPHHSPKPERESLKRICRLGWATITPIVGLTTSIYDRKFEAVA
jgi:hypothetical protein